ncbi:MAG TPA: ABC transporter permease [Terriglobales bacterium]|nr:ABC transporter permease [Terriglobales bacterium]
MGSTTQIETQPGNALPPASPGPTNGRWAGYWHLVGARLKELRREPEVIFWLFVFPILLALGLGIAFRDKPPDMSRVAIASGPGADEAMRFLNASPGHAQLHAEIVSDSDAMNRFRMGKYDLVIVPTGGKSYDYRYDPARPESVLAKSVVDDALQTGAGRANPLTTSAIKTEERGTRYIDFLIPGLLGMNLMGSGMWGIGFALVEMRQRKLLKRFLGTPMRRGDFLLALSTSRLILMIAELATLLGFGILVFRLPVMGSWATIVFISTLGALAFAALGLLSASRAQKIESASGIINLIMMPMWIFSGVFFSYERFPAMVQPIIKILPLTALNDALRATILQGASLASQQGRIAVMAIWGAVSFLLALRWFRWT